MSVDFMSFIDNEANNKRDKKKCEVYRHNAVKHDKKLKTQ